MMTYDEAIAFLEEHGVYCDPSSYPEDEPWLSEVGEYVCDELDSMVEYDEDDEEVYDEDDLLSLVHGAKAYEEDAKQRYEADMEALGEDETEDDILNESVEPFCEDYDYFNADDFEKEEIYGANVDPNSDEYKAHEEIVNKIFKPKHIEELDWSVVTSADGDGYVYKEIVHFLDRDDWDKLHSVEDSRAYKKLTPNIGDYELLVSYHLDRGIDEFADPAISFYAQSLGELSYEDDEEEEEDAEDKNAAQYWQKSGDTFGPETDEYKAHQEIVNKFLKPYNIKEYGWFVSHMEKVYKKGHYGNKKDKRFSRTDINVCYDKADFEKAGLKYNAFEPRDLADKVLDHLKSTIGPYQSCVSNYDLKLHGIDESQYVKKLNLTTAEYQEQCLDTVFYSNDLSEDVESLDESASLTEGAEKAHWRKLLDILDKFNIDYGIDDETYWNPEIKELVSIDGMDALALCSDGIYYGEQLMPWEGRFDAMKLLKALYDEGKKYDQYPSLKKIFDKNV